MVHFSKTVGPRQTVLHVTVLTVLTVSHPSITRLSLSGFSSWSKAVRIIARLHAVFRKKSFRITGVLLQDKQKAEASVVRLIQRENYSQFMDKLETIQENPKLKAYRPLCLFMDYDDTLRLGGRLSRADLPHSIKHPWLLPGSNDMVRSLILETHLSMLHAPKRDVLNTIRQRFWIMNGQKIIKSVIDKCLICFRYHAQPRQQLMGQLPSARVSFLRPFTHTGVDFAGPYQLKNFTGGGGHFKAWICLFTCMATRAIHLELVTSLSTDGFLLAFRRFIARRGKPTKMYSDNGTNFVGANHYLADQLDHLKAALDQGSSTFYGLELDRIEWNFSPPLAPHHGGAWEICVKLVKHHLRAQLKDSVFTFEQFETLLVSVESMVNSRPLTPLDNDPDTLDVLTPGHFLIGTPLLSFHENSLQHCRMNRLDQYQLITRHYQNLWKRWHLEYLTQLQSVKHHSKVQDNIQVGDLVLLMDDQPPLQWKTGRVKAVHPGPDQLVRVVTAETASAAKQSDGTLQVRNKELVRPITRIAKLPVETKAPERKAVVNILTPHSKTSWSTWLIMGVLVSLMKTTAAQNPSSLGVKPSVAVGTLALVPAILGTLMNCVALHSLFRKTKTTAYHLCLMNLCLSDLIISSILIPTTAIRYITQEWILGPTFCRLFPVLLYGSVSWALVNLIAVAAVQWYKITYLHSNDLSRCSVRLILASIPVCCYLLPPLSFFNLWGTMAKKPTDDSVCTIRPDANGRSPKSAIWFLGACLPFLLIYTASILLYFRIYNLRLRVQQSAVNPKSLRRLRHTLFRVLLTYMFGYQPILVLNVIDNAKQMLHPAYHLVAMFLAWSTCVIHPLVYVLHRPARRVRAPQDGAQAAAVTTPIATVSGRIDPSASVKIQPPSVSSTSHRSPRPWISIMVAAITLSVAKTSANQESIAETFAGLPPCQGFTAPLVPVPACTISAYWLGIKPDSTVCVFSKQCTSLTAVSSDGAPCEQQRCVAYNHTYLDQLICQNHFIDNPDVLIHLALQSLTPDLCAVGNLHLCHCDEFKDSIQQVSAVLIDGKLYPVSELHIVEEANTKTIHSYNCSCNKEQCLQRKCLGDPTFCQNIGCTSLVDENHKPCYCSFIHTADMIYRLTTPSGHIYPDCWGQLLLPVKIPTKAKPVPPACHDCSLTCQTRGLELHTPGHIPKYIKVIKNPGFVSVVPTSETTSITLTNHMLVSHGSATVDIWFANVDFPVSLQLSCPRMGICEVINCKLCYDQWVNVKCYSIYNWVVILVITVLLTTTLFVIKAVSRCLWKFVRCLTWPFVTFWKLRHRRRASRKPMDKEEGLALTSSDGPYRPTTTSLKSSKRRPPIFRGYSGPLVILGIILLCSTTSGCSEFASMSASSTECRESGNQETCVIQLKTRLAVSPIGQSSCFKIENHKNQVMGMLEIKTTSISVRCEKQLLYYTPRAKLNCQSHSQCYSLYSSSDCHGEKCAEFKANDTIKALQATKAQLGWSTCLAFRIPSCAWWLTRDCIFARAAFVNPTEEAYEVFNCPAWNYAVHLELTSHFQGNTSTTNIEIRSGQLTSQFGLTLELISASIPPAPVLDQCFLRKQTTFAIAPCNEREELGIGRLGEIQCNSHEDAITVSTNCKGNRKLIATQFDSTGVKCFSELVDPELLLHNQPLPLKLENGVITSSQGSVVFDSTTSSMMEVQVTAENLKLIAEREEGTCEASFIKLEGCYSCLSGANLFLEATSTTRTPVTATLECDNGILYSQFVITRDTKTIQRVVQVNQPVINVKCHVCCPSNTVDMQVTGDLHYLAEPDFTRSQSSFAHQPPMTGADFHWIISIIGHDFTSWIIRGAIACGLILFLFIIFCLTFKMALAKTL